MQYVYIHGFNSGVTSRSGAALEKLLQQPVYRVYNDYSKSFADCLANIKKQLLEKFSHQDLCLMGTSLGGFYALQLRLANISRVVAWNPVTFPAIQLGRFVGENTRFTDGKKWEFSRAAQLSYAHAPDPRQWRNFIWEEKTCKAACPERHIFTGNHDELLDHELSFAYWQNHANLSVIDSGHSIENFDHAYDILTQPAKSSRA